MILVIQVPLQQARVRPGPHYEGDGFGGISAVAYGAESSTLDSEEVFSRHRGEIMKDERERKKAAADMEPAVVKAGKTEGSFSEVNGLAIERDRDFPIRVTLQFYKSTATGILDQDQIQAISEQIKKSMNKADYIGSLVLSDTTRPTESTRSSKVIKYPQWWNVFWLTYKDQFSQITEDEARELLFKDGLINSTTLEESRDACFARLLPYATPKPSIDPEWHPAD